MSVEEPKPLDGMCHEIVMCNYFVHFCLTQRWRRSRFVANQLFHCCILEVHGAGSLLQDVRIFCTLSNKAGERERETD